MRKKEADLTRVEWQVHASPVAESLAKLVMIQVRLDEYTKREEGYRRSFEIGGFTIDDYIHASDALDIEIDRLEKGRVRYLFDINLQLED